MKRTTVSLPDDLAAAVARAAGRRRVSVSELTPVGFAKLGPSGFRDTSSRVEEILAEEWASTVATSGRFGPGTALH